MWQPIETAPTDGTEILGWDGTSRAVICWDERYCRRWELACPGDYSEDSSFYPTHWQQLPEPPTE